MSLLVALRKELYEQYRSHRLLIVVSVLLAFGLLSPLFARFTPELLRLIPEAEQFADMVPLPTSADAVAQYVKNLGQFGVILALLMAMGAVAREKERGTAAMVLVKPMPRAAFLGAKFVALALTFSVGLFLAAAAAYYYTLLLFKPLDVSGWLALNGLLLLFMLVYVALTLLASTVAGSQTVAGGLAFGFVVLLGVAGAVPGVSGYLPGQLLEWGAGVALGTGDASWPALGVSAGIVVAALAGAWVLLERQEV
jgi:ABC-2 type transport system permease protein